MTDRYEKNSRMEGVMTPKPIPRSDERCSYRCPYYKDGPVLSLCRLDGKPLRYDGNIPPLRNEKCKKQEDRND